MTSLKNYSLILAMALILSAVGSAFAQAPAPSAEDVPEPVLIGVLAKRGVDRCLEKWWPTAEYLTKEIPGYSFTIVTLGFDEIFPAVERNQVDFILANSPSYIELELRYNVNRLVTLKNRSTTGPLTVFGGVIFFRADREDIQDLGDLKDKSFMGVDEHSLGGWLAAWQEMKEVGVDPNDDLLSLTFAGSQDAVVYAVRDGEADVGSVRTDTLERMASEGKIRLQDFQFLGHDHIGDEVCEFPFMHSTDLYPEWPMAKLVHTSTELAEKVAAALMAMPAESQAAVAADSMGWTVPLNYQPVHDCLKELRVGPYQDYGKVTLKQALRHYWIFILAALGFLLVSVAYGVYVRRSRKRLRDSMDELLKSEERFRVIYENAPALINAFDMDGACVLWNKECQETFGWTLDEINAQPDALKLFYPDTVVRDEVMRAISSEPDGTFREWHPVTKDGRTLITMWANYRLPDGMAVGLGHDITDRKRAEAELERHREHLEQTVLERTADLAETNAEQQFILDSVPAGIFFKDTENRYFRVNKGTLRALGLCVEEIEGKSAFDLFPEHADQIYSDDLEIIRSGEPKLGILQELSTTEGKTVWVLVDKIPRFDEEGKVIGIMVFGIDVTERKNAEDELERQSQDLRTMVKAMAGRENRMAELKETIEKLRAQLEEAGRMKSEG